MNKAKFFAIVGTVVVGSTLFASTTLAQEPGYKRFQNADPARKEAIVQRVADRLGVSVEDLKKELESKTLPEVLKDHGVTFNGEHRKGQWQGNREKFVENLKEKGLSDDQIQQIITKFQNRHIR